MPKINPFPGIHPNPDIAGQVVLQLEDLSLEEAKRIRHNNPFSYVNMMVPKVENLYLRGSKKELIFKKINENFDDFLDKGIFVKDPSPAVYVYQISCKGLVQNGIWTTTSIDDYLNNTVKKHELTRAERERDLIDYLQQTGIDANPVLITYPDDVAINRFISGAITQVPILDFQTDGAYHRIWKIDDQAQLESILNHFALLRATYIADGHHRAAAACSLGIERRKLNLKHKGTEEYNFFSTVYMAVSQLKVLEFNRLVKGISKAGEADFRQRLGQYFIVEERAGVVSPQLPHHFGMYLAGKWWMLKAKDETFSSDDPVSDLDVTILQRFVLEPFLGIADPRTDKRLAFAGGSTPLPELWEKVDSGEFDVLFTLYPTSIDQLIRVADAGEVMPPKSTWFEPKFQAGLLIHQIT